MSKEKVEKLLALAFGNPNKEEAMLAFGRAVAYAQRDGIDLKEVMHGTAPKPQPRHNPRQDFYGFGFGTDDLASKVEIQHLRSQLRDLQRTVDIEQQAHGHTLTQLQEARNYAARKDQLLHQVRIDLEKLNEMTATNFAAKNDIIQNQEWEIAALKRQIDHLQAQ